MFVMCCFEFHIIEILFFQKKKEKLAIFFKEVYSHYLQISLVLNFKKSPLFLKLRNIKFTTINLKQYKF